MNLKQAKRNTRKLAKKVAEQQLVANELYRQRNLRTLMPIATGYVAAVKNYLKNGGAFDEPPPCPAEIVNPHGNDLRRRTRRA